ncbi:hypothetical protein [Streptomyces fradiae]|uniref:hypothetical protein n=1 Tax=Streptomyces fradiae TaxID=1906 RepID=UPI0029436C20|nr:hypothetical protein [Streptomyces fradiae]WOI62834.1 hypothetical protein RYQ63_24720 [Streptomyces fradiae]
MSFGDPNNPYGQQPAQPGYGQQPAQPAQPGYGYPQAPAYGEPAGYAAPPMEMPSGAKAGRIFVWVIIALQLFFAIYAFTQMGAVEDAVNQTGATGTEAELASDIGKGIVVVFAVFALVFAALGLVIALKWASGGSAVRTCAIVWASFAIVGGLFQMPIGIGTMVFAILLIVFAAKGDTAAWFKRPRH